MIPYKVHSVFESIQGEGPFTGTPAVFVRLSGCNLSCSFCDTDHTSRVEWMDLDFLVRTIRKKRKSGLVVITGGEPLLQDICPLVNALLENYSVQVETNGTTYLEGLDVLQRMLFIIVCSPKGYVDVRLLPFIQVYKYVVSHDAVSQGDGLPIGVPRPHPDFKGDVWVQPMDEGDEEKNNRNVDVAVKSCLNHGYRLSLQIHKMIGIE